jgi:hypothetical protein
MTPSVATLRARARRLAHATGLRASPALALGVLALGIAALGVAPAAGAPLHSVGRRHASAGSRHSAAPRHSAGRAAARGAARARSAHRKSRACHRASRCARRPRSTGRRAPAGAPRGSRPAGGSASGSSSPSAAAPFGGPPLAGPLDGEASSALAPSEEAPAGGGAGEAGAPPGAEEPSAAPPSAEEPSATPPSEETTTAPPPGEEPAGGSPEESTASRQQHEQQPAGGGGTPALRLFSAQSFFNEPLPAAAPRAPESAQLVASFVRQVQAHYGHAVINTTEWSAPVYTVAADAPTTAVVPQNVTCPRGEDVFTPFAQAVSAVPIPAGAQAAEGTDEDMVVWQPSSGREWELWRAQREDGQWTACWGGEFENARASDGVFPAPLGVSASGLSILAGQIHLEELQQGQIQHALEVSLPDTAPGFVWPANRDDGESHAADAIREGTRFRLKPSLDLAALNLNPVALAVATAVQRYGLIVSDTAGAVALTAQDPSPLLREGKPNPYAALLGSNPYGVLEAIPWDQLEVVSPGYER